MDAAVTTLPLDNSPTIPIHQLFEVANAWCKVQGVGPQNYYGGQQQVTQSLSHNFCCSIPAPGAHGVSVMYGLLKYESSIS